MFLSAGKTCNGNIPYASIKKCVCWTMSGRRCSRSSVAFSALFFLQAVLRKWLRWENKQ